MGVGRDMGPRLHFSNSPPLSTRLAEYNHIRPGKLFLPVLKSRNPAKIMCLTGEERRRFVVTTKKETEDPENDTPMGGRPYIGNICVPPGLLLQSRRESIAVRSRAFTILTLHLLIALQHGRPPSKQRCQPRAKLQGVQGNLTQGLPQANRHEPRHRYVEVGPSCQAWPVCSHTKLELLAVMLPFRGTTTLLSQRS